eukprot:jgi/Ulvmu1/10698/UM067_0024.1
MVKGTDAPAVPLVEFLNDTAWLVLSSTRAQLQSSTIHRSKLLKEVCNDAAAEGRVRISVAEAALHLWLLHVQHHPEQAIVPQTEHECPVDSKQQPHVGSHKHGKRCSPPDGRVNGDCQDSAIVFKARKVDDPASRLQDECALLQEADLLIDEQTKAEACAKLAQRLCTESGGGRRL